MESQPRFFETKSGLRIAYEEYGDPSGEPVIFCHGWPGSRAQGELADAAGRELGLRIISPDRPGISLSQFQKNRSVLDWPPLMADLAGALEISRYRLLAISGGAPYALAAAWADPGAVQAVAIVSGAVPLAERGTNAGLFFGYVWLMHIHRRSPAVLRLLMRLFRGLILLPVPAVLRPLVIAFQEPAGRRAMNRDRNAYEIYFKSTREAWRQNAVGAAHDGTLYAQPWGFSPGEIRVPVRFWHGRDDGRFSWKLVKSLAARIPRSVTHFVENEGHNSLPIARIREILEDLKSAK